jgi:endonuclease YncB( thermonuclease family)
VFFTIFAFFCFLLGSLTQSVTDHVDVERMVVLPACEYELDNIRVIDGDTVEADILFPLGLTLRGEYIRFSDYDAWESSKRRRSVVVTDEEVIKGKQATALLIDLIDNKMVVLMLASGERDNYGRVLGRAAVYADDGSRTELRDFMKNNDMLRK